MILPRTVQETKSQPKPEYKERVTHDMRWSELRNHYRDCEDFDKGFNNELKLIRLNRPIRMVLASGSNLFLEGILRILEGNDDIKIVAQTSKPEEAEEYLAEIKPKFLFLDNRTLDLNIQKLSNLITKESSDTKIILFGDYSEDESALPNAIYVTKETDSSELIRIIKSLSRGALTNEANGADGTKNKFTKTEIKIIDSIAECLSNKEIAKKLSISDKTVKAHLSNIFTKLNIQNRYQLIVYARRLKGRAM